MFSSFVLVYTLSGVSMVDSRMDKNKLSLKCMEVVNNPDAEIVLAGSGLINMENNELLYRCLPEWFEEEDAVWACGIAGRCGFGEFPCSPYCLLSITVVRYVSFAQEYFLQLLLRIK